MADSSAQASSTELEHFGGYSRFELELEFVQCLANPLYLHHLAAQQKLLDNPDFIAYLDYLQYFTLPQYAKYLIYPQPTLRNLRLLQQEPFRKHIIDTGLAQHMASTDIAAARLQH